MLGCLGCCAADAACCATKGILSLGCCGLSYGASKAAKVMYAFGFTLCTLFAFLFLNYGAKIVGWIPNAINDKCGAECFNFISVYRVSFALTVYHAVLFVGLFGVNSKENKRSVFQFGFWPFKVFLFLILLISSFIIPATFFINYYVSSAIFSIIFMVINGILLVDLAHRVSEYLIEKYEETNGRFWQVLMISLFVGVNIGSIVLSVFLIIKTSDTEWASLTKFFVGLNAVLVVTKQVISVLPKVQEANPQSGILQSTLLGFYTTYIVASAVTSKSFLVEGIPSDDKFMSTVRWIAIILTFLSIAYSAFSVGGSSGKLSLTSAEAEEDDEEAAAQYNYSFFHFVFISAAAYMAVILTYWQQPAFNDLDVFVTIDHNSVVWFKMVSAWFITLLYIWTLVAPIIFPDRDFS